MSIGFPAHRKDGADSLYATNVVPVVDADVHDEYWSKIRGVPIPVRKNNDVAQPIAQPDCLRQASWLGR